MSWGGGRPLLGTNIIVRFYMYLFNHAFNEASQDLQILMFLHLNFCYNVNIIHTIHSSRAIVTLLVWGLYCAYCRYI